MPARSVVFDEVRKFYGEAGHANLKTRDFYQMAGRAGRRGLDTAGNVFIRVNPMYHAESELRRIIFGKSEPVLSQFSSNYATIMNLYKQMGEKILDIYPQSFHFHQSGKRDREAARYHLKQKIRLLKDMEYILGDGTLSLKGDIASRTYSYELHVGEMYQQGYFDGLKPRDLAIVVCAMVYEPRKGIIPPPVPAEVKDFKRGLDTIVRGINYAEKRYDIFPFSKQFAFHLSRLMADWYDGATFDQIMQDVDFDDGEVVRYFRMTVQTLRELMTFEAFSEEFRARLREALRTIDRDTIDAEKQLRQEI
jgi:superfamily II RNA helicase